MLHNSCASVLYCQRRCQADSWPWGTTLLASCQRQGLVLGSVGMPTEVFIVSCSLHDYECKGVGGCGGRLEQAQGQRRMTAAGKQVRCGRGVAEHVRHSHTPIVWSSSRGTPTPSHTDFRQHLPATASLCLPLTGTQAASKATHNKAIWHPQQAARHAPSSNAWAPRIACSRRPSSTSGLL